jgi:predicted membrane chloride channel (bestrophin family)
LSNNAIEDKGRLIRDMAHFVQLTSNQGGELQLLSFINMKNEVISMISVPGSEHRIPAEPDPFAII